MKFTFSASVIALFILSYYSAGILAGKTCLNNGTLLTGTHQKCVCPTGFKGFDCGQRITPCEGNPCRNSAVCVDHRNGTFTCKCRPNFEGILCETKILPCDRKPCQNGGKCSDDGVKCFKCECTKGFKGFDCSKKVSPCEISPCQNGGICSNKEDEGFKCICAKGWTGLFCTRKEPLFGSTVLNGNMDWIKQLEKWLPLKKQGKNMKICFRASVNGWASSTFHYFCDDKGPTVVLVKSGHYVFGGYAGHQWGGSARYIRSDSSFIFSFRNRDVLEPFKSSVYRYESRGLYTNINNGPTFGGGHDIYIANNAGTGTASYCNLGYTYRQPSGYSYSTSKLKNLLAGTYNFTPTDVEVYYFTNNE